MKVIHADGTERNGSDRKRASLILCADDDDAVRLVLKCALGNAGHQVECVPDAKTALARALGEGKSFDIVITDHDMGGHSGLWLIEKLRASKFSGKIIVHSSALTERDLMAYRALGVDRVLTKPASLPEVFAAIDGSIEEKP